MLLCVVVVPCVRSHGALRMTELVPSSGCAVEDHNELDAWDDFQTHDRSV